MNGQLTGAFNECTAYFNWVGTLPLYDDLSLQMGFGLGNQHLTIHATLDGQNVPHPQFDHWSPEFSTGIKYNLNQHIFTSIRLMMYTGKVKDSALTKFFDKVSGGVIFTQPILINWTLGYLF